ncbi:MAG: HI0074 family nucleotidyltransferase substrate-binding subunit [Candidatus Freyarchaeota archaeon]|nr:HI0074 family nucleotidyltransferase substrate-binding subunit [Candidatus Freyrarchaeum guaymaensis]
MRERVKRYFTNYEKALRNLREGVEVARTDIEVDGAIKRFELCYELVWKLIKEYLADVGIICRSPRDTFREARRVEIIEDERLWMEMIEDRNALVHTYEMEKAREIFRKIKNEYVDCLQDVYEKIKRRIEEEG